MKTLYIDCFSGISGDMTLGAFLDMGIEETYLKSELAKLNIPNFDISSERVQKQGITGTICHVHVGHEHVHRNMADITKIINDSILDEKVKETAIAIFTRVAKAEGTVHGKPIDEVHFHEVGALDSIVDIVGAAICYHKLAPEKVLVSAINVGSGWVQCAHGKLPVPAPAVVEIIKDSNIPMYSKYIEQEAATPTGVAIAAELAEYTPEVPDFVPEKIAYGFGTREFPVLNGLRMMLGEMESGAASVGASKSEVAGEGEILVLETNLDDCTGEAAGYTMERLLAAGAKDAFFTPIQMKKNRPAMLLTVLADPTQENEMVDIILRETTTIGIRKRIERRTRMERTIEKKDTPYGEVRVKVCTYGDITKKTIEYDDAAAIAQKMNRPFTEVMKELTALLCEGGK